MPILSILISLISCIISALTIYRRRTDANPSQSEPRSKFSVSQYLECAEKAYLEILQQQEPFEYEIVLWWGFDGVRLNKDGSPEWISRKQELITTPEGYAKLICPLDTRNLCNSKARIDVYNIADVWTQNRLEQQTNQIIDSIQSLQSMQNTYIPYPAYVQQIQSCCCDFHNRTNV